MPNDDTCTSFHYYSYSHELDILRDNEVSYVLFNIHRGTYSKIFMFFRDLRHIRFQGPEKKDMRHYTRKGKDKQQFNVCSSLRS